jgi:general stress protein 26
MPLGTATIEMQNPEEHRERLHDLVKATRAVLVLSCGHDDRIVGQPMVLLRTGDDTTMYVATALDADQVATLSRDPRVTVVVPGAGCAMFEAEVVVSRDRALLDELPGDAWRLWSHGRADPRITILVISPIEGAYWDGAHRHSYQYRLGPRVPVDLRSDAGGAAVAVAVEA